MNRLYATYNFLEPFDSYGVHFLNGEGPPRPVIQRQGRQLSATGATDDFVWYQLNGSNNMLVTKLGSGASFEPTAPGVYCVTARYGLGWAVSMPFDFKP